jgi:ABC-2 type transport system ATP-binding protein
MIDVKNLTRKFGDITAVEDVSFHIDEGEVFGFLGPNGAGKTTTVRMLCCLIAKTSGEARIAGLDTSNPDDALKIRSMIGLVPDDTGLYGELSAWDNLDFYGKLYDMPDALRRSNIEKYLKMLDLWGRKDTRAGAFSKGMRQKLAIARALLHEPKILFLDEPTASLDPESSRTVRDFILELKSQKRTIFLNTHNLDEAQKLCDRIGILRTRLLTVGTPAQLQHGLWGSKTRVQLDEVDDALVAALKLKLPNEIEIEGNNLDVTVKDAEKENPDIVAAIVSVGGRIQSVSRSEHSLEDVYLEVVRQNK